MIAARAFNKEKDKVVNAIYGCVTTGEIWQFAKLQDDQIIIDLEKYYDNQIPKILGILQQIVDVSTTEQFG